MDPLVIGLIVGLLVTLAVASFALYKASAGRSATVVDLDEFNELDDELKTLYRDAVIEKVAPAAMRVANAAYAALKDEGGDVGKEALDGASELAAILDDLAEKIKARDSSAMFGVAMTLGSILNRDRPSPMMPMAPVMPPKKSKRPRPVPSPLPTASATRNVVAATVRPTPSVRPILKTMRPTRLPPKNKLPRK